MFDVCGRNHIIDIGGDAYNWQYIDAEPDITIVNLCLDDRRDGRFGYIDGDARQLTMNDNTFDIAYSNSVIEHVGGQRDQEKFARETRRVAPRYFVQTPNRWFFIEPHFITPFIHFLPKPIFRRLLPFFSIWYWINRPDRDELDAFVDEIKLLSVAEMQELFPDAEIVREKFFGFTKSIIAIRR